MPKEINNITYPVWDTLYKEQADTPQQDPRLKTVQV
jgi:hypothetical protein